MGIVCLENSREQIMTVHTYGQRNENLKSMGFDTYKDYLASPLWQSIKLRAFLRHGRDCSLCPARAVMIHHNGYGLETLKGENLSALVPICYSCHRKVEFTEEGKKRTLVQVQTAYMRLWKKSPRRKGKVGRTRCVRCNNKAKKNSMYCRPCSSGKLRRKWNPKTNTFTEIPND